MLVKGMVVQYLWNKSLESDLHLFRPTNKKERHMLQPLKEKAFVLISYALGKRRALSYSHLSTPTKS
jgi:CRISPR/Cas system-associated protein Cas10 (large subunit of type III CRISPR-Cas system)